tara:strand:- start:302 stop:424 length:123 start_codon:yes stop_codon:yes gene_type:complete
MNFKEKFEKFLDECARQVGGYKALVVVALFVGYILGSIFN